MIIDIMDLPKLRNDYKSQRIALCHGVFGILHAGYISHFLWAKSQADVLVVSVTSDRYARRNKIFFSEQKRLEMIDSLKSVDYCLLSDYPTAEEIITELQPDVYIKGEEYRFNITESLSKEIAKRSAIAFDPNPKVLSSSDLADEITEAIDIYSDTERIDCILYCLARYKFVYRLLHGDESVLDCGCGYGYGAKLLSKSGARITGCDKNDLVIQQSRKRFPEIDFLIGDVLSLDLAPFDVVVCMEVIEHVEDISTFLERIKKLTKQYAVFSTPRALPFEKRSRVRQLFHVYEFEKSELISLLKRYWNSVLVFTQTDEIVSSGNATLAWTYIVIAF